MPGSRWFCLALVAWMVGHPSFAASPLSLVTAPSTLLGVEPTSLHPADLNSDGRTDLLVTTTTPSGFTVLLADATGRFATPFTNAAPGLVNGVTRIRTTDFNGDGKPDALVLGTLLLYMTGDGAGHFNLVTNLNPTLPSGSKAGCADFAIADFNGDGRADVAAAFGGSHVQLLLGNGNGTFTPGADLPVGADRLFLGDFTGDAKLDLLYTVAIGSPGLIVGHGDGTFDAAVTLTNNLGFSPLAIGDFNGDTRLDLATLDANKTVAQIFPGTGAGTFLAATNVQTRRLPTDVAAADLDGDGRAELVVANRGDGTASVFRGDATLFATWPTHWSAGFNPKLVAVGDVTGDGKLEVIVGNQISKSITLLENQGNLRFAGVGSQTIGPDPLLVYRLDQPSAADLDADGNIDVAVVDGLGARVLWGDGRGGFPAISSLASLPGGVNTPTSLALGDLNADNRPDLVMTLSTGSKLGVYMNSGGRNFAAPQFFSTIGPPRYVHLADLDLDGRLDATIPADFTDKIVVLPGLGGGQFAPPAPQQWGFAGPVPMVTTARLGGGPPPETLVVYSGSSVIGFITDSVTNLSNQLPFLQFATPDFHPMSMVDAPDVNRDGRPDLVFPVPGKDWVTVALGQGNGAFAAHTDYTVVGGPRWLRSADLDGDTYPDLVVANAATNTVTLLSNNGAGGFANAFTFQVGPNYYPTNVVVADLNNDGKPDVITANGGGNTVSVLLSATATGPVITPPQITQQPVSQTVNAGSPVTFSVAATGDSLTFQWRHANTNLPGATSATYQIPSAQTGDAGTYVVVVSNPAGSTNSNPVTLTVNTPAVAPQITQQPVSRTVSAGAPASFSVTATGTALSYQWRRNGADIPGATAQTFTLAAALPGDAGSYTVVVSNPAGSATSNPATLTVTDPSAGTLIDLFYSTVGTGANSWVNTVAVQPDGRVLAGGLFTTFHNASRPYITRLNTDGSLDTTFNPGAGPNGALVALALQPDQNILIGGFFTSVGATPRNRIARLTSTGALDPSFNPGTGANNKVGAIALQTDGRIIVGGDFTNFNGVAAGRIIRLTSTGAIDPTFTAGAGADNSINAIALQADGKILVGGAFTRIGTTARTCIARLNTNGTVDTTFNPGTGAQAWVNAIALQPDGRILIGGPFTTYNGVSRRGIARLNTNGTLDTTFNPGTGADNWVNTIALQSDGRVVIGGIFTNFNAVRVNHLARLNTNGSLDASLTTGSGFNETVQSVVAPPDGTLVAGGLFTAVNGIPAGRIARLNALPGSPFVTLTATTAPGSISFSWPVYGPGWVLESTTSLTLPFAPSGLPVVTLNGVSTATAPIAPGAPQFFELRRP